jgi:low temperature requirement protein LtrA
MESGVHSFRHEWRRMAGRNPHEAHRVATPLELLFDLTFATSFSLAATQFANALSDGRVTAALVGFSFASLAICWAWISFSWFSSAYDTDDWMFRIVTMVQMVGVLVLAIGLPRMFASIENGQRLDNSVMVLGYVIMRVALLFQWLRAAREDPARRRICLTYAATISIAQVGWVVQIVAPLSSSATIVLGAVLVLIELSGPALAERQAGGTPWHADHIAERYSLFAIIALGEGVVGTAAALSAVIDRQGWTLSAVLVGIAGVGLTFGMWWVYYLVPSGEILKRHRDRASVWGYVQILIVTSIVATGAGLQVAASFIEQQAHLTAVAVMLAAAVPVVTFLSVLHALNYFLTRRFHSIDAWLLISSTAVAIVSVIAAASNVSTAACLVILMFAPVVTIVVYELRGYRRQSETLAN